MKKTAVIGLTLFTIFLTGCKDIGDVAPQVNSNGTAAPSPVETAASDKAKAPKKPTSSYPLERKITDLNNRTVDVKILAKNGNEIALLKTDTQTPFILTLDKLSESDQIFLNDLKDGGDFSEAQDLVARHARLAGRVAVWHSQSYNAEKEATRLGLPLLTVFAFNEDPRSSDLEKNVLYSKNFRSWANQNLALCLVRLELTSSPRAANLSEKENRIVSSKFGVVDNIAFILSPPDHAAVEINTNGIVTGKDAIKAVSWVVENPARGTPTKSIEVPKRTKKGKGGKGGK